MGWDVIVYNFGGSPPPPADQVGDSAKPVSMGRADEVRRRISAHVSNVDWSDPTCGLLKSDELTIEFSLEEARDVEAFELNVRGRGDPIGTILRLCKAEGWSALDTTTDQWLDPDHPSDQGWKEFQAFRDRAIAAIARSCPKCSRVLPAGGTRCDHCDESRELEEHSSRRLWLFIGFLFVGISLFFWRKSEPRGDPTLPAKAMKVILDARTYLKVSADQGRRVVRLGQIEAGQGWENTEFTVRGVDGRVYVSDPWGRPIRVAGADGDRRVYSVGPNGIDERGAGDDIGMAVPDK